METMTHGAFTCHGNYGKYQKPTWKMHTKTIFHWVTRRIYWCTSCQDEMTFSKWRRAMLESWKVKIC